MYHALPNATFGRTGFEVTRLSYGAMQLTGNQGASSASEDQIRIILNAALDAGINLIDTSSDYGRSEEFIGKHTSHRRHEYYLATKCGCAPDGEGPHTWTKENLFRGLEESLKRLRTDYVDVMQLHGPSVAESQQGNLPEALQEMHRQVRD